MEVQIEENCLKTLALHQPVAIDLRFIIAVLKINNDLERVGDLAVNVAERAAFLATQPPVDLSFDFQAMARQAQEMLKKSLDALVNLSAQQAREVLVSDDEIDAMNRQMYRIVQEAIHAHPDQTESLIHMLSASRHLERIADHATQHRRGRHLHDRRRHRPPQGRGLSSGSRPPIGACSRTRRDSSSKHLGRDPRRGREPVRSCGATRTAGQSE